MPLPGRTAFMWSHLKGPMGRSMRWGQARLTPPCWCRNRSVRGPPDRKSLRLIGAEAASKLLQHLLSEPYSVLQSARLFTQRDSHD